MSVTPVRIVFEFEFSHLLPFVFQGLLLASYGTDVHAHALVGYERPTRLGQLPEACPYETLVPPRFSHTECIRTVFSAQLAAR